MAAGNEAIKEYARPTAPARPTATIDVVTSAEIVHGNGCRDIERENVKHTMEAKATKGTDAATRIFTIHMPSQNKRGPVKGLRTPHKNASKVIDAAHVARNLETTSTRNRSWYLLMRAAPAGSYSSVEMLTSISSPRR
jgi:hypothetical protein